MVTTDPATGGYVASGSWVHASCALWSPGMILLPPQPPEGECLRLLGFLPCVIALLTFLLVFFPANLPVLAFILESAVTEGSSTDPCACHYFFSLAVSCCRCPALFRPQTANRGLVVLNVVIPLATAFLVCTMAATTSTMRCVSACHECELRASDFFFSASLAPALPSCTWNT